MFSNRKHKQANGQNGIGSRDSLLVANPSQLSLPIQETRIVSVLRSAQVGLILL